MNIIHSFPPNINKIRKVIDLSQNRRCVFTYGEDIYNPFGGYIDEPLGLHEATHSFQQEDVGGAEFWWDRWLSDTRFRVEQELVAYGHQYRRYCELEKHRNKRAVYLFTLAQDLASEQYGKAISLADARKRIGAYAPH
jgi:hypothetical protein